MELTVSNFDEYYYIELEDKGDDWDICTLLGLSLEKYREIYPEYNGGNAPTDQYIHELQGYYFAQNSKGEFSDNEGGLKEQKKI